jgi:hypothetical protein
MSTRKTKDAALGMDAIKIILKMTAAVSKAVTAIILAAVTLAAVDFQVADILVVAMAVTLVEDFQVAADIPEAVFRAAEGLVLAPVVADSTITVRRRIVLRVFYSKSIRIGTARLMPRK